jgi:hypothetical protein
LAPLDDRQPEPYVPEHSVPSVGYGNGGKAMTILRVIFVVVAVCLGGLTSAHALDESDIQAAIENAKTPADHEAIAAYFDEQAKEARETATRHQKMGAVYKKSPPGPPKGGGGPALHKTMGDHCDSVAAKYEQAAKDYEAMAAAHRAEAKAVR